MASEAQWEKVTARHAEAVRDFVGRASTLSDDEWRTPVADGKWTPAQITQHLVQTYEILLRQVLTGVGLRVVTGWFVRQMLRAVVLRQIMWTRRLPAGAKAVRELLPDTDGGERVEALARLSAVVATFEAELFARRHDAALRLTHHCFGAVAPAKGLDFVAVHTAHHARQLPEARGHRP